jgi:nicotinate phosphoribosyltransferase
MAAGGIAELDILACDDERLPGRPLLEQVMKSGRRVARPAVTLDAARARARDELDRLPRRLRGLAPAEPYRVEISAQLAQSRDTVQRRHQR